MMKPTLVVLVTLLAQQFSPLCLAQDESKEAKKPDAEQLRELLFDLSDIRFKELSADDGNIRFLLDVKQLTDHDNEDIGSFYQRVYLHHRGFDKPVLINTNGYNLSQGKHELVDLLDANYISVEHRYFGPSTPKPREWKYLTIQQAAGDYHNIRKVLGRIYKGKWVSTGISKGGETCTYYRHFYPDDVVATVPYVAPFPNGFKDQRFYKFLDTAGSQKCRDRIHQFQLSVLKHKDELVPRMKYYLKGRGASVDLIGGPEAALELFVMEFPFAFWQGGKKWEDVPDSEASVDDLIDYFIANRELWYILDKSTKNLAAHYYQHATQLGYYAYRAEKFGDLIEKWDGEPSACLFREDEELTFDPATIGKMAEWLKTDAEDIVFLYGGLDTWTVAQARLGTNKKVSKYVFDGKHHGNARLSDVDEKLRKEILKKLKAMMNNP